MSAFTGPQHKGAMRAHREHKRLEAQERQAGSKAEYRRRQKRAEQLLRNIFGDFETELEEPS